MRLVHRTCALLGVVSLVALPRAANAQQDSAIPPLHAIDRANFDTTCAPCRDFFGYVNGGWLARTTIPPQYTMTGVDRDIQDRTEALLRRILNDAAAAADTAKDADTRLVGRFYGSCMDSARVEREGARPLQGRLDQIAAIRTRAELAGLIGEFERDGVGDVVSYFALPNLKNSRVMALNFYQGGLALPDRDFYLRPDSQFAAIRREYAAHVTRMLMLLGTERRAAAADARRIVALETAIARTSIPAEEARQFSRLYHPTAQLGLKRLAPDLDWNQFAREAGVALPDTVNVMIPVFLKGLDRLVREVPLSDWRAYLRWHLAHATAAALSTPFQQESLVLRRLIEGQTELKPRWQRCQYATDQAIGEALGKEYVKVAFQPAAKARMQEMVANIRGAMHDRITALTWMSDSTRAAALAKLDAVLSKIGYPEKWRDYSRLALVPRSLCYQFPRGPTVRERPPTEPGGEGCGPK